MISEHTTIDLNGKASVSAILTGPDQRDESNRTGVVIAHGASNDMHNSLIVAVAGGLANNGYISLRFNFPYKEKGRKSPDSEAILTQTWQYAYTYLVNNRQFPVDRIIAAGKSMGGRIVSQMVAAEQLNVAALIFLGYPLHAPGRTDKLRDTHLYEIDIPMLFFAGTKDPLCKLEKLQGVLDRLQVRHDIEIIEGGNHSFNLPKSSTRSNESVHRQIIDRCLEWLESIAKYPHAK